MPERIQQRRTKGWRLPLGAKSVARPSRWGNPFRIEGSSVVGQSWTLARMNFGTRTLTDGMVLYSSHSRRADAIEHAVGLFRTLVSVTERDSPALYELWVSPLRGHDLACYCPLDQPCHVDVLLEVANA